MPHVFSIDIQEIKVAVDAVVFSYHNGKMNILLVQRKYAPFEGQWAFPGGFVSQEEDLDDSVIRELQEETELVEAPYLEQIATFGKVNRDPRRRVIAIAYMGLLRELPAVKGATDATSAQWWEFEQIPRPLAFDHDEIFQASVHRLKNRLRYSSAGKYLMPDEFTKPELEALYRLVLGEDFVQSMFDEYLQSGYYTQQVGDKYRFL